MPTIWFLRRMFRHSLFTVLDPYGMKKGVSPRIPSRGWIVPLCFALALAAIWLAALLTGGPLSAWDAAVLERLRAKGPGSWAELAFAVTWLGDWLILVPLALGTSVYLWHHDLRNRAWALIVTVAAVRILVAVQKEFFARARPDVEHWMVEHSPSFPSAHSANSLATLLAIALLVPRSRVRVFAVVACACSAVVGMSRIVLGVHWPSDVAAGWAFALFATMPLWSFDRGKCDKI